MNIKNNLINYLFDRDYIVSLYDDCVYIFNYKYLDSFKEKEIVISLKGRVIIITGEKMSIVKMTKEELLIKGIIANLGVKVRDE